jgi:hypothetical protein
MSFTFQGKNIQDLYKTGNTNVISGVLKTLRAPINEFEKNFANGIKINNQDINEQAVSQYMEYTSGDNVFTNNVGYKHISVYGRTTKGGRGSNSGECKSDTKNRGGATGGDGGGPVDYAIQKVAIGTSNIRINFESNIKHVISVGNTVILSANQGAVGNNANSPGRCNTLTGKECCNSGANGNTGAVGTFTSNVGSYNIDLSNMYIAENYIRLYLHYQP